MKTARDIAHQTLCRNPVLCDGHGAGHTLRCDSLTAAIEARDAEHREDYERLKVIHVNRGEALDLIAAERDRLRTELEEANERVTGLVRSDSEAVRDAMAFQAERDRLRAGLQEIAEYETDYTVGPAENVNRLQAIAEAALKATGDPR